MLAPSFGTTLHVWSALITVTLAALAAGYAAGGRVADRRPGLGTLMATMICAAGTLLLSDWITKPVLRVAYLAGTIGGTFVAAALLFGRTETEEPVYAFGQRPVQAGTASRGAAPTVTPGPGGKN